jgi:hypothetical protein
MGLGRLAVIGLAAAVVLGGIVTGVALSDRDEPAPVGAIELRKNEDAGTVPVADDERGGGDNTGPRFRRVAPAPIPAAPAPAPAPPARDWSAGSWSGGGDT